MIYVGNIDERKRISLGLEMEECELKEGEAHSVHDDVENSAIDPDIDLSYIEVKIQNVLGHFQKDFEGGISAENLGAKFGGYGSFLPTYQRSPSWSHTRSPAEVHNYDSPRSPKKIHAEDQRQDLFASSNASPLTRSLTTSGKTASVGSSLKGNGYLQPRHTEVSNLESGASKKSLIDQRTLKVRIKVGSENLPTQENAGIYSGLGLVSPSSSLDDSPTTSEGQCGIILDVPEESPTSILQIMTSYSWELLLSPLSDDLILLPEKRKLKGKCETKPLEKTSKGCGVLVNGSHYNRSNKKVQEQKQLISSEKIDDFSIDLAYEKNNGDMDSNLSPLKKGKETEIYTLGCEELVSNALKLPLLSSSHDIISDPEKDSFAAMTVLKDGVKGEIFSTFIQKEHLETESSQDIGRVEKLGGRFGSSGKASESKGGDLVSSFAACPQEDLPKAERPHTLDQSELSASKGLKTVSDAEPTNPWKVVAQNGGSVTAEGLDSALEKSSSGGKWKQKESQRKGPEGVYMAKYELMAESSLTSKNGKSSHANRVISKFNSLEKPGDRYKDFFGTMGFADDDNESISGEMTSSGRLKDPPHFGRRSLSKDHNLSKEKQNSLSSEKSVPPDKYPRPGSLLAPPLENGQSSEAPTGMIPLVKEDWVECDRCKQWRLLPLGTNPRSLPDKWLCRMLTWLPGMNRCSIPEEETTNALRALYHPVASGPVPASENQVTQPYNPVATSMRMIPIDAGRSVQEHQNIVVPTATISGKKKPGSAKAANSADLDGSTHSSNSRKKNLGTSGKINKLNSGNNSPSIDASGYQHMRHLNMAFEKCNDVKTEKVSPDSCYYRGTNVKIKSKGESEMEGFRASKRMKSEELHFDNENWTPNNCGDSSKAGRQFSSLSNNTSGNDRNKYNKHNHLSSEATKNVVSHVPCTSGDSLLFSGKCNDEDSRKRKVKENHGSRINTGPVSDSGRHQLHSGNFVEESMETDHQKEKKARYSKSGGKASEGTERKSRRTKDQHDGRYLNNTQPEDYLKNGMASAHPSVTANSGSSKVSGSHENKTSGQEIKGSPVESVSSSPLRFPNAEKVASTRKDLDGQYEFHDSVSLTAANPTRLSDGEDAGNNGAGVVKKGAVLSVNNHVTGVYSDQLCQSNKYTSIKHSSEQCKVEVKANNDQSQNSDYQSKKSGNGLSSYASGPDLDKANVKACDSRNDSFDYVQLPNTKSKSRRNKSDEKSGISRKIDKKDTAEGSSSESSKGPSKQKLGYDGQDAIRSQDKKHDLQQEHDNEKLPKKSYQTEVYGNGNSHSLPSLARVQTETVDSVQPVSGSQKENGVKFFVVDAFDNGDTLKAPNQRKKSEIPNGQPTRHPTPNSHKVRDVEAPSPVRRDSTSHAANNALKEAKDLKHMADRLKNSGSTESIGLYFQAALKFLHGASLLESGSSETIKHNELMHSMHIYRSTAKLCEFCAHEYEKSKDMAAAALAYKCVEIAYMRVVYSSHGSANRDRKELQTALPVVPPGESPSSSASDVDNVNHEATADKAALTKVVSPPQVSGSQVITSRIRSGLLRLLNFAQDVNFAMEASRKSRIAFTAATSRLGETSHKEGINSLKKALDFNFQDVEGLLLLVRIAMEAINR